MLIEIIKQTKRQIVIEICYMCSKQWLIKRYVQSIDGVSKWIYEYKDCMTYIPKVV